MALERFSQGQIASLASLGVIAWGAAALTIRHGSHTMFTTDLQRIGTCLGSAPALYGFVRLSENLVQVSPRDRLTTTCLLLAPALLFDGVAMMWFPNLYEDPSLRKTNPSLAVSVSRMGAASILFGAGLALVMGFF